MAPRASRLAAAILEVYGIKPRFVPVPGDGVLDVFLNGDRIFSRDEEGFYPTREEILARIQHRLTGSDDAR